MKRLRNTRLPLFLGAALVLPFTPGVRGQDNPVVFRGAAIETVAKAGRLENATLVLRDGKITAVGKDVAVPAGARVIDATGKTILPGLIDPYRVISVASSSESSAPRTIVIRGRTITLPSRGSSSAPSFTRIADNFYPYDRGYRALPRSGLTGLNLVSSGYGQSAIARVTPKEPETMLQKADGRLYLSLTNNTSSLDVLRNGLRGRRGGRPPGAGRPGGGRPGGGGPGGGPAGRGGSGAGRGGSSGRPSSGASTALWREVSEGKAPLFVNAANAATILHLLRILEDHEEVDLVLTASESDLYQTLDQLNGRKVRVILDPGVTLKPESRDRLNLARTVHEAGLTFAFKHPSSSALLASQDAPLFPVAYLIKGGLPRRTALEALTLRPAEMIGADKTMGSLEPGKAANLLIFEGDPFDPASQLRQVLIAGRMIHEN